MLATDLYAFFTLLCCFAHLLLKHHRISTLGLHDPATLLKDLTSSFFICTLKNVLLSSFTLALKSSPSKKSRSALTVPRYSGPGAAWSASQLPSERDHHIFDLRGARSFPVLENDGRSNHWSFTLCTLGACYYYTCADEELNSFS